MLRKFPFNKKIKTILRGEESAACGECKMSRQAREAAGPRALSQVRPGAPTAISTSCFGEQRGWEVTQAEQALAGSREYVDFTELKWEVLQGQPMSSP